MDAVKGSSPGKARDEYVDISRCYANSEIAIVERLEKIQAYYNPRDAIQIGHNYFFVAVHGE